MKMSEKVDLLLLIDARFEDDPRLLICPPEVGILSEVTVISSSSSSFSLEKVLRFGRRLSFWLLGELEREEEDEVNQEVTEGTRRRVLGRRYLKKDTLLIT